MLKNYRLLGFYIHKNCSSEKQLFTYESIFINWYALTGNIYRTTQWHTKENTDY